MTTAGDASRPPVGALADEAAQLLDALAVRLAQVRQTVGAHDSAATAGAAAPQTAPDDAAPAAAGPGDDGLQCVGWCPVCRSADLLRGDRPEVAGKLVESAIVVVQALRSLLPATPAAGPPSTGEPGPPPHSPGIERIDIR